MIEHPEGWRWRAVVWVAWALTLAAGLAAQQWGLHLIDAAARSF